jgi:hypothetical protein
MISIGKGAKNQDKLLQHQISAFLLIEGNS